MFAIFPDRIGEKSDQIWDWIDEQNTIILQGLKGKRVRKTEQIIIVKTKQ